MKKILIMNAVPTNNGDAALVFALREKLIENGYDVTISTTYYKQIQKLYPNYKWDKSLYEFNRFERFLIKFLSHKILINAKILFNTKYKCYDAIIGAPGGYINSYYGFDTKLYAMNKIKKKSNAKMIMYSQSVGPLNSDDKKVLDKYIKDFDLFMVRDDISYDYVKNYKNILKTNDAAFLLEKPYKCKESEKIVAISVREWSHDNRSKEKYIDTIKKLAYKVIDNGYKVEFISTCQGIENYVDDSLIAREIYLQLDQAYQKAAIVNINYYNLDDLRGYITKFEFVIGTRLHMCILSIISGVPAFNISYEVKGKECYKYLNLSQYSIDYNDTSNNILDNLQNFIDNQPELKNIYKEKYDLMHKKALEYYNYMINKIID